MRSLFNRLEQYNKATNRLDEMIKLYESQKEEYMVDAIIQRFEFCVELAWKLLKEYLEYEKLGEFNSPRVVLKEAYKLGLIDDGNQWLDVVTDRNLSSHTYDEELSKKIKDNIINIHFELLQKLLSKMEENIKNE